MRLSGVHFLFLVLLHISILLLLIIPGTRCRSINLRQLEQSTLDNLTKDGRYDKRIRPNGVQDLDGPVAVRVNMFIRSFNKIDENSMEYSLQLTFRQYWIDDRLQFDDYGGKLRYLTLTDPNTIWKPDLFFSNENKGHIHNLIQPNVLLRIFPVGQVLYSVRVSLVLSCPMNLKDFPLDTQTCHIKMASYGYTTEDLVFVWKEDDPVQITKNFHLLNFNLHKFITDYCTSRTNTGEYSCLKVSLDFNRISSYYLYHSYIPFGMLVVLSWVTFWIERKRVNVRVFLAVAAMLAMVILNKGNNFSLPQTSYMKAIDVWTAVCHLFVFCVLLESVTVSYIYRRNKRRSMGVEKVDTDPACLIETNCPENGNTKGKSSKKDVLLKWRAWLTGFPNEPKIMDFISRILFPVMFIIFNLIYWTTYPTGRE